MSELDAFFILVFSLGLAPVKGVKRHAQFAEVRQEHNHYNYGDNWSYSVPLEKVLHGFFY